MSQSIRAVLAEGEQELMRAGIKQARLDARLLLQHLLKLDHAAILSGEAGSISLQAEAAYGAMIMRRSQREPVSRITGSRAFFGNHFNLTGAVLDPRPDTEILVEQVLADLPQRDKPLRFADIGTGSGAIAISLLKALPKAEAIACDISDDALEVARANAQALGVSSRFHAVVSDFLAALDGQFDFVVSNPPYIARADLPALQAEVRLHDPLIALDGGVDGLAAYRAILSQAMLHIRAQGRLYLEFGAGQYSKVWAIAEDFGWDFAGLHRDLGGLERVLVLSNAGRSMLGPGSRPDLQKTLGNVQQNS